MKQKVLELLIDAEHFLSGEEMSHSLGVSRTAVWKHIKKLREEGYSIESITNKGYRLTMQPDQLDAYELEQLLGNQNMVERVFVFKTIDSTNKEAKRRAMEERIHTALLLSEEQTIGIGRRGRQWVSNKGEGIYMSLLLRPSIKPINASMLTLVAGLAVKIAIKEITGLDSKIKWPNDLVIGNKKICGILTEMSSEIDFVNYVVIGIGINVNNQQFEEGIQEVATSLSLEGGESYPRKGLIVQIIKEFEKLYEQFLREESLGFMADRYNMECVNIGKKVKVEVNGKDFIGKAIRVNYDGALLICGEDGKEVTVNSGEVSVRGLFGYVD
ncbi:MAG: biotin--[acetyl-CoA-carboxylase] ligase [Firmicutes bacterium HGW-Firmicutes-1]|nr:MAG: biotin--[acetyl-CoA-carboxylase] ligase [Firmicutes bacterium HGW-Firmicutes-1]